MRRVCRLPYFDFREVASAPRLAQLLDDGVTPETLEKSLTQLSGSLAGTDRSLAQLTLLVQDDKVVVRDEYGVLNPQTRQRLLDFETQSSMPDLSIAGGSDEPDESGDGGGADDDSGPFTISFLEAGLRLADRDMKDWSADEWFHEGCRLAEESEFESAVNAFRNSLSLLAMEWPIGGANDCAYAGDALPDPADLHFHLADVLYRIGHVEAAIERYHCAIEFAPTLLKRGRNWAACVLKPAAMKPPKKHF